jgi:hypothetical protein
MKTTLKVLTSIFALGLIILVGLHMIMLYGLTKAMREVVLPQVKEQTGIDADVGRLSINMASGLLYLKDVEVRNPDGFLLENLASIDRIEVEVDIASLFTKKPILVKNVEVDNARVNIIRNQDGELNFQKLQEGLPAPSVPLAGPEPGTQPTEPRKPTPEPTVAEPVEAKPIPELLIKALQCDATVRYLDFKLNELDIALDLSLIGGELGTLQGADVPWGSLALIGSLGDDRTSFITDIRMKLAPVTDPDVPSFDLKGKILEIDPRLLEEAYSKLGIRSAPFGLDPVFHCREGRFSDSQIALTLREIELEEKLADRLGGMARIGTLKFSVPVEGTLQEPTIDLQGALGSAIGGNTRTLLDSFLKGVVAKETGVEVPQEMTTDAAVDVLADKVDEVGESETTQKVLKDILDGKPTATNEPPPVSSDTVVDILGEHVKEIGDDEELKDELKNLGRKLFGR